MNSWRTLKIVLVLLVTLTLWAPGASGVSAAGPGTISGTVYEADGVTPIAGVFVEASGGGTFVNDCTDASGNFTLTDLPVAVEIVAQAAPPWANCGSWTDHVHEFWPDSKDRNGATPIVLTSGNPARSDVDFVLDPGGAISGTTYAADGVTPLPHIAVSIQNGQNTYGASVCSDANGEYAFHGAPLDMPLRIRTDSYRDGWCDSGGDFLPEYWQESPDSAGATLITLTQAASSQSGIDFTLEVAGSISGTVYEADGVTPIPNLLVSILGGESLGPDACTDGAGHFTIHNVPFDMPVYAYAHGGLSWCGSASTYTVEFHDGMASLAGATALTVSEANANLTGIDFTLDSIPTPTPDPFLRAWYAEDAIETDYWPVGTTLTLEIEDTTTPAFPDFSTQMETSEEIDRFDLSGQFDVEPGMFVVVSGASITRIMLVDTLTITEVDSQADTIAGTTSPGSWLWMYFAESCCRSTVADGTGMWMFDYSVPGAAGEPVADIRPGSDGAVHVPSGDGSTSVYWRLPAKNLHVVPAYPEVHGHDWAAGTDVTLVVDDDDNAGNGTLYEETKNTDTDPWCGSPCFDLTGLLELEPGQYVTLTDGIDTKTVQISPLEVTSVNISTDTITGRADPGSRVAVNIWSLGGIARYVTTAGNGTWVANFSVPGDEDFEQDTADIQDGDNGRAIQLNPDGSDDGTLEYWTVELPVVDSITRAGPDPTNAANVEFTVTFSDSVTGVDVADFSLAKVGLSGTSVTKVVGSGDTYTVTVKTGSGNGTLRLNVVDNDSILNELKIPLGGPAKGNGNFSTGEEYTVARSAPSIPVLLAPTPEAQLDTLQPELDWKDSIPAAHHYQLQVATSNSFASLVWDEPNLVESTFTIDADLLPGKVYYWRVRAFNLLDLPSGWSIVRAFRTPLAQPILIAPADTDSLPTDRPAFEWNEVDGATQYNLQVSASPGFGALLVNVTSSGTEYTAIKDLAQIKQLYWRVRAKSATVTGPWSDAWTFTTGNPATVPALVAPTNNALVKSYTPLLNWNDSKLPAGTTFKYYEVQLDEDAGFAAPDTYTTNLSDITDSDFTPSSDLASNTKYYWRVRAVNVVNGVDHYSGWSTARSFRTVLAPPTGLAATLNTLQPTFEWDDASGSGEIKSYTIQVSINPNFKGLLLNVTTQDSFYQALKNLPAGKVIHWRVRVNGANGPSEWTAVQFTTP